MAGQSPMLNLIGFKNRSGVSHIDLFRNKMLECPPTLNAIKLSPGEHAGSPLHPHNTRVFVGADLRVCP